MDVSGAAPAAVALGSGSVVERDVIEDRVGVGSRLVGVVVGVEDMKGAGEPDKLGGSVVVAVADVDVDVDVDVREVEVEVEIGIEVVFSDVNGMNGVEEEGRLNGRIN